MNSFLWRSFLSGMFVVVPVTIVVIVLARIAARIRAALESIAAEPTFAALFLGHWAVAGAVLVLLLFLVCLGVGLVLNLPPVQKLVTSANTALTKRLPFYGHLRGVEAGYLGRTGGKHIQAALVELDETLAPAFIAEELSDGRYVVFVPAVPSAREGTVCVMTRDRVHLIDASARQVVQSVHHWGVGTEELIKTMRKT